MFMFLVGLSAGGLVVASSGEVFNVPRLKPLAPLAIWLSLICIGLAALEIIPDLGSPQRLYALLLSPQANSPLIWDLVIISTYMVICVVYLWLHARAATTAQPEKYEIWVHRLAFVALPAAVLVHSITAWIFGLQISRSYWYSALLAPAFLAGALVSGLALVILAVMLARRVKIINVNDSLVSWLAQLLAAFIAVDLFFTFSELLTRLYPAAQLENLPALILLTGRYASPFWIEVLVCGLLPFILLAVKNWRVRMPVVGIAASLAIVGIFLFRFNLLMAGFAYPLTAFPAGIQVGQVLPWTRLDNIPQYVTVLGGPLQLSYPYSPTILELAVVVGLLAAGAFVWLLGLQLLPLRTHNEAKT